MNKLKHVRFQADFDGNRSIEVQFNYDLQTDTFPMVMLHCNAGWKDWRKEVPNEPEVYRFGGQWYITGYFKDRKIKGYLMYRILQERGRLLKG